MKKYIIDRFEGIYAICEDEGKSFINIEKDKLPSEIKEGDCIISDEDGIYSLDIEATEERKRRIRKKLDRLFE